jgi:hypothetical protein
MQIRFTDRPIGMGGDGVRIVLRRAPEVRDVRVEVVDGFEFRR